MGKKSTCLNNVCSKDNLFISPCNARYDEMESPHFRPTLSEILRALPIEPYQAWAPSSEMQVSPKSMLFTGLLLFNSWATAWICTKRGKLQPGALVGLPSNDNSCVLATSRKLGELSTLNHSYNIHYIYTIYIYIYIYTLYIHHSEPSCIVPHHVYHDHLPFVRKRMHRDAQSSSGPSLSTSSSASQTPTRPWPLGRRSDHLRGQR